MKKCLVLGAGGFIGGHLVKRLKSQGHYVRGVDIKEHEYTDLPSDQFYVLDLRSESNVRQAMTLTTDRGLETFDEVYQLAADMGGAGYIFTGDNDADVMHNSAMINMNVAKVACEFEEKPKVFYSSSACIYPEHNQLDPDNPNCKEDSAYPANPDSEYGWEKLFSERMFMSYNRNYGLDIRIARFHNIFGPEGSWDNGKEKAPAALCRKVAEAEENGEIEIWGDGKQTRSFLYVDECLEAVERLMDSDCLDPVNIGSEEMISINDFALLIAKVAGKNVKLNNIPGPLGVRGRNSDNDFFEERIGWRVSLPLEDGVQKTYKWIAEQVKETINA